MANLYERWLKLPNCGSSTYGEFIAKHDTCPVCCPGCEDNRDKLPRACSYCGGSGLVKLVDGGLPCSPFLIGQIAGRQP